MTEIAEPAVQSETEAERRRKEAYFTASQAQLIWARFKRNRAAMVAATVLLSWLIIRLVGWGQSVD